MERAIGLKTLGTILLGTLAIVSCAAPATAAERARDLGIPFDGRPGPMNAITDVPGVTVGYSTLIADAAGDKKVRTGVTAILPRGKATRDTPVFAAVHVLNGNGELTGAHWIAESGQLEGPILLTNTHSVGVVHDAAIAWRVEHGPADDEGYWWSLPVVAETWDGYLNDINGMHVRPEHVRAAIETASAKPQAEGNVGGGTGMICHEFKCGTGTSSRVVRIGDVDYRLGVLVQANYGVRRELRIAGVPVGRELNNDLLWPLEEPRDTGSIIVVVATDAPLLPHQLRRVAQRPALGLGRMGSYAGNGSGDIFVAFSTAQAKAGRHGVKTVSMLDNDALDALFLATARATEEAIVNAMIAARTLDGQDGHRAVAIDHQALRRVLRAHGRLRQGEAPASPSK